jgi:hypothetical protein
MSGKSFAAIDRAIYYILGFERGLQQEEIKELLADLRYMQLSESGSETVGSWNWLRGVIGGLSVRKERISGQMISYIQRDEVLAWLDEGERRAALAGKRILPPKESR